MNAKTYRSGVPAAATPVASWTLDHDAVLALALHVAGSALSDDLSVRILAGFVRFIFLRNRRLLLQDLSVNDPVGLPSRRGIITPAVS